MSEEVKAVLSLIGTLVLMLAVFAGAFYASKWIAKKYQPGAPGTASNIEILDRLVVGKDQRLVIVRTGGKILLLGVSPQQITKIEELDQDSIIAEPIKAEAKLDFLTIFKDITAKKDKGI